MHGKQTSKWHLIGRIAFEYDTYKHNTIMADNKYTLRVLSIIEDTTVDGPGFRTCIYCAGCTHACEGCHNPQSWNRGGGEEMNIGHIMQVIKADPFANVTFSGGDPMLQAEAFTALAKEIKRQTKKDIWCYTGFVFESLLKMKEQRELLQWIDVLVDGPFIKSQKDLSLLFRGSSNQRLIDVQQSLQQNKVVLWTPNIGIE